MFDYTKKIKDFILPKIVEINNPTILEFGVQNGRSTKMFLEVCSKNNGKLYSVDIEDCSKVSKDKNWTFIKCRDDDFDILENKIPKMFDIIFIDSLHEAKHVKKIIFYYFKKLKLGGRIFIDDISWVPYHKNSKLNNFYCEINNRETFDMLIELYNSNLENLNMYFSFDASGLCEIIKIKDNLKEPVKIQSREFSTKNLLRKYVLRR